VTITGLKELNAALKKLEDSVLSSQVKAAFLDAADLVAVRARGKVPSRSGRAAGSISAGAAARGAYVQGGKGSVPYYGWLDFGSRHPIHGNPRSVGPWSGSGTGPKDGRFIYPAIDENSEAITELVYQGLNRLFGGDL
jgi:hypothetical protein